MTPDALARVRRKARERDAVLEKFYDTYEVPGGVPAVAASTMHDDTVVAGDALMHRSGIVRLASQRSGYRPVRIDIGPIGSPTGDPIMIVNAALQRIGADLHAVLGPDAAVHAEAMAAWYDAEAMRASFVFSMKESAYETWRQSGLATAGYTTVVAGRPMIPYDSKVFLQKALSPILTRRIRNLDQERRERVDPVLSMLSIALLVICGVEVIAVGATPATMTTVFASLTVGILSRIGRRGNAAFGSRMLRANRRGITIAIICATILATILPGNLAYLPMILVTMMVLAGVGNGMAAGVERTRSATASGSVGPETPRVARTDGTRTRDVISSILEACSILPLHRQEDARSSAEVCRMIEGFDADDPAVEDALRSIRGLDDLLAAHETAMRYARDEERTTQTLKLVDGLESAAMSVDAARVSLLAAASRQVDTHARYLASRTPSALDPTT